MNRALIHFTTNPDDGQCVVVAADRFKRQPCKRLYMDFEFLDALIKSSVTCSLVTPRPLASNWQDTKRLSVSTALFFTNGPWF
jgi:hypothetical protein